MNWEIKEYNVITNKDQLISHNVSSASCWQKTNEKEKNKGEETQNK